MTNHSADDSRSDFFAIVCKYFVTSSSVLNASKTGVFSAQVEAIPIKSSKKLDKIG